MNAELEYLINKRIEIKYQLTDDHIFVIGAWPDTIEKEIILVKCIKKLKEFNVPILLVSHLPISVEIEKLVDYYIFDSNNDLLYFEDIKRLNINSLRFLQTNVYDVFSYPDFHHDFAVLTNIRNAINFSHSIGKTKIHYLEYDNIIDTSQYYQTFITDITNYDYIIYEYDKGSLNKKYCAAFMFSIKTDLALKMCQDISTLENHFSKNDWRLENYILNSAKKYTTKIKNSNYIDNDDTINMCYIINKQILKDFTFYIIVDPLSDYLYISFDSMINYVIEIKYNGYEKFHNINNFQLVKIGKYINDKSIILKHMGKNIFEKKLVEPYEKYKEKNYVKFKTSLI